MKGLVAPNGVEMSSAPMMKPFSGCFPRSILNFEMPHPRRLLQRLVIQSPLLFSTLETSSMDLYFVLQTITDYLFLHLKIILRLEI
jgi:hypothetical protein